MPHIRRRQCWRTALPTGSPPPPTSGFPPKDATTRPLNLLVHCLPSPAFPPWAGDVAGPLSSEGAQARHLGLISNAAALCERQVDAVFRLSLDVAAIERERERERGGAEREAAASTWESPESNAPACTSLPAEAFLLGTIARGVCICQKCGRAVAGDKSHLRLNLKMCSRHIF